MAIAYYEQDTLSSTAEPHINPIASSYAKSTLSPSEVEKDKIIFHHFAIEFLGQQTFCQEDILSGPP